MYIGFPGSLLSSHWLQPDLLSFSKMTAWCAFSLCHEALRIISSGSTLERNPSLRAKNGSSSLWQPSHPNHHTQHPLWQWDSCGRWSLDCRTPFTWLARFYKWQLSRSHDALPQSKREGDVANISFYKKMHYPHSFSFASDIWLPLQAKFLSHTVGNSNVCRNDRTRNQSHGLGCRKTCCWTWRSREERNMPLMWTIEALNCDSFETAKRAAFHTVHDRT